MELLSKGKRPDVGSVNKRFKFYDSTFLNILANESVPGRKVFTRLFRNNDVAALLRFLNNESSIGEEIKIITSLPVWPFLKAGIREVRMLNGNF